MQRIPALKGHADTLRIWGPGPKIPPGLGCPLSSSFLLCKTQTLPPSWGCCEILRDGKWKIVLQGATTGGHAQGPRSACRGLPGTWGRQAVLEQVGPGHSLKNGRRVAGRHLGRHTACAMARGQGCRGTFTPPTPDGKQRAGAQKYL